LFYWGSVERGAHEGWTTAQLWESIRAAREAYGGDAPRVGAIEVGQLRAYAGGIVRAANAYERLPDSSGLSSEHFAEAPWSRPLSQRNTLPMYQVRFEHVTTGPGGESIDFRSVFFRGSFPATKQDLEARLEGDAALMAADYDQEHVQVQNISILAA